MRKYFILQSKPFSGTICFESLLYQVYIFVNVFLSAMVYRVAVCTFLKLSLSCLDVIVLYCVVLKRSYPKARARIRNKHFLLQYELLSPYKGM